MTTRGSVMGWLGAASTAGLLVTGATALALTTVPSPPPLMLDPGPARPAAPVIAAITEVAPQVVDAAPTLNTPPVQEEAAPTRAATDAPTPSIRLPQPEVLAQSDIALPKQDAPPAPVVKPQEPRITAPEPKPQPKPAASVAAVAPQQGQPAQGGAAKLSAAAYAKAVMKKVRATKRPLGAGKGVAVVGFTVADSGGLAGVQILRSSGNAALDQIAIGHIQRSAPFPTPPAGVGRSFSFEFIGK